MSKKIIQISSGPEGTFALHENGSLSRVFKLSSGVGLSLVYASSGPVTPAIDPPHKTFTPKVYMDGNKWCALYGEDLQVGVCGFGDTPAEAIQAFNQAWIGARA